MHLFIEEGVQGLGVPLPEGMDPDDVVRKEGPEALRRRVEEARPLLEEWVIRETKGPLSLADRARRAEAIAAVIGKIQGRIERDLYFRMAAERLAVDEGLLRESVGRDKSRSPEPRPSAAAAGPVGASASAVPEATADPWDVKIARAEEELLAQILREPGILLDPGVEETLTAFASASARGVVALLREAGTAAAAALVDRAADSALGSLVTRLASLDAPLDERPPLEIFHAAAWELDRMRLEREVRNLSRELHERERQGELPAEMLRRKADLTRELGKYKGIDGGRVPPGGRE
jgi:DNA primase